MNANLMSIVVNKILIVDDDSNIRQIAQISLEDDWDVVPAASGSEAIELARSENPDLILLDRMMPGMDGLETLFRLRQIPETANIPVIFLTAKVLTQDMNSYAGLQVVGVLPKPFNPMSLPNDIRTLLTGWERRESQET